jgi:methionyl aminopeptidase
MASIELFTPSMIERMREACRIAADSLVEVGKIIQPGITTEDINTLVHDFVVSRDAYPSSLNYKGFPKSLCTSVNDVVCHGIPGKRVLRDGDIVNVDVVAYYPTKNGFHGDTSVTFYVGEPSEDAKRVVETSRRSLELGILEVAHGKRIGDIGAAIEEHARSRGCSVVRDFVGHGVGREMHLPPQIPHYGKRNDGKRMKAGMVFTIEPMINLGGYEIEILDDDWTVLTRDRKLSAQFEHTLLVTRDGVEVLTARNEVVKSSEDKPWAELGERSSPAAFATTQARPAVALEG